MDVALYISKCSDLKNAVLIQVVAKEFLFLCLIKYDKTQSHRLGATGAGSRVGTLLDHIDQVSGTVPRTAGTFLPCGDLGTEAPPVFSSAIT